MEYKLYKQCLLRFSCLFLLIAEPFCVAARPNDFAMGRRENTFRIDFSNVPKKPDNAKVHSFCATVLGLKQGEVLRIQNSRTVGSSFVKVTDLALAQRICEEHDNKHDITVDGKKYPLRITLEEGAVEVRLYDLSEDVTDKKITEYLVKYGDVIAIREQRCGADVDFPGISTGVRVAKMIVKRNIESWVTIDGEMTQVSYYGQRQTCRHCRDYMHIGATCVQNKKLLVQKSYADAAKQMSSTIPPPQTRQLTPMVKQMNAIQNHDSPEAKKADITPSKVDTMPPPKQIPNRQQAKLLPVPPSKGTEKNSPTLPSTSGSTLPSIRGSLTPSTGQQPSESGGVECRSASLKSNGNETDSSVDSSSSKRQLRSRPPGKKPRVGNNDDVLDGSKSS